MKKTFYPIDLPSKKWEALQNNSDHADKSYINVQSNPLLQPKYAVLSTPLISIGIWLEQDLVSFQGTKFMRLLDTFARGKCSEESRIFLTIAHSYHGSARTPVLLTGWSSPTPSTNRSLIPWRCPLGHYPPAMWTPARQPSCQNSFQSFYKGNVMQQLPCYNN